MGHHADVADSVVARYNSADPRVYELHFYGPLHMELQVGTEKDYIMSFDIKEINSA